VYKPHLADNPNVTHFKADECLGFTILKDTFAVIQNFDVIKKRGDFSLSDKIKLLNYDKPEFIEVLGGRITVVFISLPTLLTADKTLIYITCCIIRWIILSRMYLRKIKSGRQILRHC